jgi:hypothetical protein
MYKPEAAKKYYGFVNVQAKAREFVIAVQLLQCTSIRIGKNLGSKLLA